MKPFSWDNHVCLPLHKNAKNFFKELDRHRRAGFSIVSVNIGYANITWEDHLKFAHFFQDWILQHDSKFLLVKNVQDITTAHHSERLGIILDVEGANLLEGNIERIVQLYHLGVRWMCLTYNSTNDLVGGCLPDAVDKGLTKLGRQAIQRMNKIGMVICCNHTGSKSVMDIIEYSESPTIFSHSNCWEIYNHWRNISDEAIKACAVKGGVICVNGVGPFLQDNGADVSKLMAHIDHLVQCVGPEHVGIGLDYVYDPAEISMILEKQKNLFGGDRHAPTHFSFIPPEALGDIYQRLNKYGYSKADIALIFGGNLRRIAETIWL